eukprot:6214230-Pleurochrysis_carterae.AAC.2
MFVGLKEGMRATEYHSNQISSDNPPNGSLAGLYSGLRSWRDIWDTPHDPIGCIRSAATFYVVPVATILKIMFNVGLRPIFGCRSWRP